MDENDLVNAEKMFKKLADNAKNPLDVIEEARYCEAECQLQREDYRNAAATYKRQLKDLHDGKFTQRALEKLYFIANLWLNDTREQAKAYDQQRHGKVWLVTPMPIVHFDHKKPFLDEEGNALQCLETIIEHDRDNKLKEDSLFLLATVKLFRGDYSAADDYYTALWRDKTFKNSPYAVKACKQSVLCKLQVNGGTVYNPKTIEEARKALFDGQERFPELRQEKEWLDQHFKAINVMQADRDFKIAEFYRASGKPGAAYFYYELVRRRYPGSNYEKKSEEYIAAIRVQVEREQEVARKAEEKLQERSPSSNTDSQVQQASWFSRILPDIWPKKKDEPPPRSD